MCASKKNWKVCESSIFLYQERQFKMSEREYMFLNSKFNDVSNIEDKKTFCKFIATVLYGFLKKYLNVIEFN